MTEEWRIIAEFPDYAASSLGEIKRVQPDLLNHRLTGRPLKQALSSTGYAQVSLCRDAKARSVRVNRIICAAFHGPAPAPDYHAAHNDGDRLNNRADNLRWVLGVENEADKRRHGTALIGDKHWTKSMPERRAKGTRHGLAKLNDEAVRRIRQDTRLHREIAADYGVHKAAVSNIKRGKTWSHVA